MLKQLSQRPTALNGLLIVVVSLLVAVLIGVRIGSAPLTYQDMITGLALAAFIIILIQKRGLEIGFFVWIMAFILGFRTIKVTAPLIVDQLANGGQVSTRYLTTGKPPDIVLHPLFLVIFLLLGLILLQRAVNWQVRIVWLIPIPLIIFSIFWIWGWVRGAEAGKYWLDMFSELMPFLMLPAIFIVTASILQKQSLWKPAITVLFGVGVFIGFLGLLEILFPNIVHVIPGYTSADTTFAYAQDGFQRATFTFFGETGASFIIALVLPAIIPLWSWYKRPWARALLAVCCGIGVIGIYISGHRSLWLMMILVTIALLLLRGNWGRTLILAVMMAVGYNFLPATAQKRAETLFSALQGKYEDNSSQDRVNRSQGAIQSILTDPLGLGWTGAGWVHDDFLQIAANLGVIPGALFALWYLFTLVKISRAFYESSDPLTHSLVGLFMVGGILLLTEPLSVLPQYITPVWFVWALVETKLGQIAEQRGSYSANKAHSTYSDLQLPGSSSGMSGIR